MASTIERIDEELTFAGFENKIPINSLVFAGGDGNAVEESPIGYYRFHFWKADGKWKDHENWIANTDVTGPMCISLLQDQNVYDKRFFYRLLIRSVFGIKSVILLEEEISDLFGGKKPNKQRVLGAGLKLYIDHEKDKQVALQDEFGALSIRTSCTVSSISSDMIRSLPTSRLREANVVHNENNLGISRRSSIRGGSISRMPETINIPNDNGEEINKLERNDSIRRRFKDLSQANPFELVKSFTQIKEKNFYQVLLDLESAMDPKVFHFDVIIAEGTTINNQQNENWKAFTKLLGDQLTKQSFFEHSLLLSKQGRVPSSTLEDLYKNNNRKPVPNLVEPKNEDEDTENYTRHVRDLIMTELRQVTRLLLFQEYLLNPFDPTKNQECLISKESFRQMFDGFGELLSIHVEFLNQICRTERIMDLARAINFQDVTNVIGKERVEIIVKSIRTGEDQQSNDLDELLVDLHGQLSARDLISEHFLLLVRDGGIEIERFCSDLVKLFKEGKFSPYLTLLGSIDYRKSEMQKNILNVKFFQECVNNFEEDPLAWRQTVGDVMTELSRHPQRYPDQMSVIIKTLAKDDSRVLELQNTRSYIERYVQYIDAQRGVVQDTKDLFNVQNRVCNLPIGIVSPNRYFVHKMAVYEVEKGEVQFSKRLTLYLLSDFLIAARKRRNSKGKFKDRNQFSSKTYSATHEFLFLAPVSGVSIKRIDGRAKARNKETCIFSLDIPIEGSLVYHDGLARVLSSNLNEEIQSHYILVPKKQRKLETFIEKLENTKHQFFIQNSNVNIFMNRVEDKDLYFQVYKQQEYYGCQHKNRIAILYLDSSPLPTLEFLFPEDDIDVLMVVQVMNGSFRFNIRAREMIVASSECFDPVREFQDPKLISRRFINALINSQLLHLIYPPFSSQVQLQQRQQLEHHIEPFSRGIFRKFRELVNKMSKTQEATYLTDDDSSSIYSIENTEILCEDQPLIMKEKKSVFGKMLGKLKSPLSKKLESIPE